MIDIKVDMHRGELIRELAIALRQIAIDDYDGRRLSIIEDSEARRTILLAVRRRLAADRTISRDAANGLLRTISYVLLNAHEQKKLQGYDL